MIRYWLVIAMLACAAGWLRGADDLAVSAGPHLLAKATGCVQVTRCGATHAGPIVFDRKRDDSTSFAEYHVIRSAEELAVRVADASHAQNAMVQKQAEAQLAKFLNVEAIDWDKQMVVALLAKYQLADYRPGAGDFEVEFCSLRSENGVLHVGWRQATARTVDTVVDKRFSRLAYGVALLNRFAGKVSFAVDRTVRFTAERPIVARAATRANQPNIGPIHFNGEDSQLVIRSAEQLAFRGRDPGQYKDATVQKQAEADLAQSLNVKAIDWNKQMVIAIDGLKHRDSVSLEFVAHIDNEFVCAVCPGRGSLQTRTVAWRPRTVGRDTPSWPKGVVLVDRFDGTVEFKLADEDAKDSKAGDGDVVPPGEEVAAEDARELRIIASAHDNSRDFSLGPVQIKAGSVVIRNAAELVAASSKAGSAKEPAVQKELEAELAKLLKVEAIDWNKQMVLAVRGNGFDSLKVEGKVLTATFVPHYERPVRAILPWPKALVLTERFEGEVKFVPRKELKVLASAQDSPRAANIGPIHLEENSSVVIRSAAELVAASSKPKSAKNPAVQKEMAAELAKLVEVEAIDWNKQMVLAVRGEPGTKADRVHFDSLKIEGNVLTVAWKVRPRPPHAGPGTPIAWNLLERFDGEVKFVASGQK
jgi:hypothetical protein